MEGSSTPMEAASMHLFGCPPWPFPPPITTESRSTPSEVLPATAPVVASVSDPVARARAPSSHRSRQLFLAAWCSTKCGARVRRGGESCRPVRAHQVLQRSSAAWLGRCQALSCGPMLRSRNVKAAQEDVLCSLEPTCVAVVHRHPVGKPAQLVVTPAGTRSLTCHSTGLPIGLSRCRSAGACRSLWRAPHCLPGTMISIAHVVGYINVFFSGTEVYIYAHMPIWY
ncbi:hypothetical protein SEVIR_4G189526v4 [Setaria viridis]